MLIEKTFETGNLPINFAEDPLAESSFLTMFHRGRQFKLEELVTYSNWTNPYKF